MNPKYYDKIPQMTSVVRYHRNPGPIQQTVAAHSWGVAWLITEFHPEPSVALIRIALEHDLEEHFTSDVCYTSKKRFPDVKLAMHEASGLARDELGITRDEALSIDDQWWLKWADLVEGCMWCRHLALEYGFRDYNRNWGGYLKAVDGHLNSPLADKCITPMARMFSTSLRDAPRQ